MNTAPVAFRADDLQFQIKRLALLDRALHGLLDNRLRCGRVVFDALIQRQPVDTIQLVDVVNPFRPSHLQGLNINLPTAHLSYFFGIRQQGLGVPQRLLSLFALGDVAGHDAGPNVDASLIVLKPGVVFAPNCVAKPMPNTVRIQQIASVGFNCLLDLRK